MAEPVRASHDGLSKLDVAKIRNRLLEMRTELDARRSERDLLQLKQIETALAKLNRGGYGLCESCERPVIKTRLLDAPHVRYCAICSGGRPSSAPRGRTATA